MKQGIGYTIVSDQYRLIHFPAETKIDQRAWDLTDEGEAKAQQAAKEEARKRRKAFSGFVK